MGNDLTTTNRTGADPYSPPVLTTSLASIVDNEALWIDPTWGLPALNEADRAAAERALVEYDAMPRGCAPDRVAKLLGSISWMPMRDGGADQARMQLAVYKSTLADIDDDVLTAAVRRAVQTLTFLPTVAELRAIAQQLPAPERVQRAWRLRQLLAAPAAHVQEHVDLAISDEELAAWPQSLRETALHHGWITQAQFDAAAIQPEPIAHAA